MCVYMFVQVIAHLDGDLCEDGSAGHLSPDSRKCKLLIPSLSWWDRRITTFFFHFFHYFGSLSMSLVSFACGWLFQLTQHTCLDIVEIIFSSCR